MGWWKPLAREAVARGLLSDGSLVVFDAGRFVEKLVSLRKAFSAEVVVEHHIAVKSNPLTYFLSLAHMHGVGAECASMGELLQALDSGVPASAIVFDSPAKTVSELRFALSRGFRINADNLQEVARISELLKQHGAEWPAPRVGIRVNPQVGAGAIESSSTATQTSKFGVAAGDSLASEAIVQAFRMHDWLSTLHVHVGSQGCPLSLIAAGVKRTVEIADEIDRALCGARRVTTIDIGGGLPVGLGVDGDEEDGPSFEDLCSELRRAVPALFSGRFRIITEFGRAVNARCAFVLSKVEYTKSMGGRAIAICHVGADLFIRSAYSPERWPLRITVLAPDGTPKQGPLAEQDIAGPLCFSGDLLARKRMLPKAEPGDIVLIHDAGAYTYCMYSHYNLRVPPPVAVGWKNRGAAANVTLQVVRRSTHSTAVGMFQTPRFVPRI